MNTDGIKQVVFDFGGVLIEWAPKHIVQMYSPHDVVQQYALECVLQHPDWLELDKGTFSESQVSKRIANRSGFSVEEVEGIFETVRRSFTAINESVSCLTSLVSNHIPCYGLSNMSMENWAYLQQRHDFFGLLKGVIISGHEKVIKPDEGIFALLCQRYQLIPEQTLFIDDMPANCAAAEEYGFNTLQYEQGKKLLEGIC